MQDAGRPPTQDVDRDVGSVVVVARGLEEIARRLAFAGETKFRIAAFEHGAQVVEALGDELGAAIEAGRLRDVQGIGRVLEQQILELWSAGSSELLSRLRDEQPEGAAELVRVAGMTPRRIVTLHDTLGVRSVRELWAACADGRVRSVRGFGEATERRLLVACERALEPGRTAKKPLLPKKR